MGGFVWGQGSFASPGQHWMWHSRSVWGASDGKFNGAAEGVSPSRLAGCSLILTAPRSATPDGVTVEVIID